MYTGRILSAGMNRDGKPFVAYRVSSRSFPNRKCLKYDDRAAVVPIEGFEKDIYEKKYEEAYTAYLEALDKYVMDSIYKKVKNGTASPFEEDALSRYYMITHLKETQYLEYKYKKQE